MEKWGCFSLTTEHGGAIGVSSKSFGTGFRKSGAWLNVSLKHGGECLCLWQGRGEIGSRVLAIDEHGGSVSAIWQGREIRRQRSVSTEHGGGRVECLSGKGRGSRRR